jgi:hypothetical protein
MANLDEFYAPEIIIRLIKESNEIAVYGALAKIGKGVLTSNEVKEDCAYWKERMIDLYNKLGWNSKLIDLLNDN